MSSPGDPEALNSTVQEKTEETEKTENPPSQASANPPPNGSETKEGSGISNDSVKRKQDVVMKDEVKQDESSLEPLKRARVEASTPASNGSNAKVPSDGVDGDPSSSMSKLDPPSSMVSGQKASDSKESPKTENGTGEPKGGEEGEGHGQSTQSTKSTKEIVSKYIKLDPLPSKPKPLAPLSSNEKKQLERYLEFEPGEKWPSDWIGSMAYADKDIWNPDGKSRDRQKKPLFIWAERGKLSLKLFGNLFRFVYNMKETPAQAKRILAGADATSAQSMQLAKRRVSYDPIVLRQDGWITAKSPEPIGASGGPYRIGEMVHWQGYAGIAIAYTHDEHLGDLWKAMWMDEWDTFDLEAEELEDARKRYDRKNKPKEASEAPVAQKKEKETSSSSSTADAGRRSGRYASADFSVKGIEHGIVMAVSYSRGSRPGVFWPARVMHFSEMRSFGNANKRVTNKQKVDVVFLAPYWNSTSGTLAGRRNESYSDSVARLGSSVFSSGALFEVECIDASDDSIHQYPYDCASGLDMDELRSSFKFSGLPKAAFSRFVDSHRLALGLKTFSQKVLRSTAATDLDRTTASLFEAHPIAGQTACFPEALLHLPYQFILSQLPPPEKDTSSKGYGESASVEPALEFGGVLESMKPPACFGRSGSTRSNAQSSPDAVLNSKPLFASPPVSLSLEVQGEGVSVDPFLAGLTSLSNLLSNDKTSMSILLAQNLSQLVSQVPSNSSEFQQLTDFVKRDRLKTLVKLWVVVKTHGEELISSCTKIGSLSCLEDWRRACERVYKYITKTFTGVGFGNGTSWVITDSLCNYHLTSPICFERAVRVPGALKAAKEAGAGKNDRLRLMTGVKEKYLEMAEKEVVRRAHSKTYLTRMKKRCNSAPDDRQIISLTEDSEGNGGEDTKGSKGSWKAAIAAVAAAVQGVDMITNGECVNAFCATRPPGHHAGRELHAMKAVSNGFCLLNAAACAALYATAPVSEGGPGLRRVCIIDIDVHHGNGTQDILCSTYDPRFLYVSLHAGGADVNGVDPAEGEELGHHLGRNPKRGIFPGRCGDKSPHQGVLNIPLGPRVTSHALGASLVTKVTPAVEKFSPELIIVSAGFDAHKNDPLNLGGLSADDFGTLTEVICKLAHKLCSGRVLSILEGGYGIPCCRPQTVVPEEFLAQNRTTAANVEAMEVDKQSQAPDAKAGGASDSSIPTGESANPSASSGVAKDEDGKSDMPAKMDASIDGKPDPNQKQLEIYDMGNDLPADMKDEMPYVLQKRLDKAHAEGFVECVREHVKTLAKCNMRN